MTKTYFTLITRDNPSASWVIEFGAWEREDVDSERQSYRDHGVKASDLKIIRTDGRQASIDARVADLNLALSNYDATPITELDPLFTPPAPPPAEPSPVVDRHVTFNAQEYRVTLAPDLAQSVVQVRKGRRGSQSTWWHTIKPGSANFRRAVRLADAASCQCLTWRAKDPTDGYRPVEG
jgi:hypothetical protein